MVDLMGHLDQSVHLCLALVIVLSSGCIEGSEVMLALVVEDRC